MRKKLLILLLLVLPFGGCYAGTSADLLSYDAIQAAAVEAQKGVEAYNATVLADAQQKKGEILKALGATVALVASETSTPEEAASLAARVVASMQTHMANLEEQERRRQNVYEVTRDNLEYIVGVCEQSRQFVLYRSSISEQWKEYLQATARARLPVMETPQPTSSPVEALVNEMR